MTFLSFSSSSPSFSSAFVGFPSFLKERDTTAESSSFCPTETSRHGGGGRTGERNTVCPKDKRQGKPSRIETGRRGQRHWVSGKR